MLSKTNLDAMSNYFLMQLSSCNVNDWLQLMWYAMVILSIGWLSGLIDYDLSFFTSRFLLCALWGWFIIFYWQKSLVTLLWSSFVWHAKVNQIWGFPFLYLELISYTWLYMQENNSYNYLFYSPTSYSLL